MYVLYIYYALSVCPPPDHAPPLIRGVRAARQIHSQETTATI